MRLVPMICRLLCCLPLCGAAGVAQAEDMERHYTGLAFTYTFGGARSAADADLSLGRLQMNMDAVQKASVLHLPVVQLPLIRKGEPNLAPVRALVAAFGLFGDEDSLAAAPAACASVICEDYARVLPDLGE